MTLKRWDGAAFVDLTTLKRWDGTSWIDITLLKRWDGSAWIDIPLPGGGGGGGSFTATASPGSAVGAVTDDKLFVVVTSNSVTVTPAGGTAPYTHLWTYVSGDSAPVPTSSTAASTAFSATVGRDQEKIAVWKDTVTDALGATASVNVSVSLFHNSNL